MQHGDGGKGSERRPGQGYGEGWDRIFGGDKARLDQAIEMTIMHGKPSLSLLMREMGLTFNQAARLMSQMEDAGVITKVLPHGDRELIKPGCTECTQSAPTSGCKSDAVGANVCPPPPAGGHFCPALGVHRTHSV